MKGSLGAGEEEAQRGSIGGQELDTRPPSAPAGTGPQVEASKGGGEGKSRLRNGLGSTEPTRANPPG